jgi:hypothetical protein
MLPWRRIFSLSDSQLIIAKRDNAKALFRAYIDSKGGKLQVRAGREAPKVKWDAS